MIVHAKDLTKKYQQDIAVNQLTFSLEENKCIALIGPNGAGKTTTLRMLAGLIRPTSGTITFPENVKDFRQIIGYLPQHPVFFDWMTGEEYLIYIGQLFLMSKADARKKAHKLLAETDIYNAKDKPIATYSGGMKQRLGIAQAIIHEPKLLMLDEPVSALDPVGRRDILTLIEQLKHKMTVLFSTHILADADEVCDDLLLMRQGSLVESGSMSSLRQKYQSSKIELTFSAELENIHHALNTLETVTNVSTSRQTYHITVTDLQAGKNEILQAILANNWPLQTFHMNQASLEDMFMKVVQS